MLIERLFDRFKKYSIYNFKIKYIKSRSEYFKKIENSVFIIFLNRFTNISVNVIQNFYEI